MMKDGDDGDLDRRSRKETEKPSSVNYQAPILNILHTCLSLARGR